LGFSEGLLIVNGVRLHLFVIKETGITYKQTFIQTAAVYRIPGLTLAVCVFCHILTKHDAIVAY